MLQLDLNDPLTIALLEGRHRGVFIELFTVCSNRRWMFLAPGSCMGNGPEHSLAGRAVINAHRALSKSPDGLAHHAELGLRRWVRELLLQLVTVRRY